MYMFFARIVDTPPASSDLSRASDRVYSLYYTRLRLASMPAHPLEVPNLLQGYFQGTYRSTTEARYKVSKLGRYTTCYHHYYHPLPSLVGTGVVTITVLS